MKLRVAVVYGGRSGEHEISIRSAESIIKALDPEKYKVLHYFISKSGKWRPRPIVPEPGGNPEIDVVFPVLHGTFGEDGTVQGMLELAELPYVGAGVLASALAMDKEMTKRVCRASGIAVVEYMTVQRGSIDVAAIERTIAYPMFVKPANLGSSVGISKVHNRAELEIGLSLATQFDSKVIVERGITGREFECAVLGNEDPRASIPCEILPSREFYDYEDKYLLNQAKVLLPTDLTEDQSNGMRWIAVEAYKAVGCEGMARVDFLMESSSGQMYVNEINTIPGFTSISMYPKMWEATGIPYSQLVDHLIQLAIGRNKIRRANRYSR